MTTIYIVTCFWLATVADDAYAPSNTFTNADAADRYVKTMTETENHHDNASNCTIEIGEEDSVTTSIDIEPLEEENPEVK